jgi:hypothetical protein
MSTNLICVRGKKHKQRIISETESPQYFFSLKSKNRVIDIFYFQTKRYKCKLTQIYLNNDIGYLTVLAVGNVTQHEEYSSSQTH